MYYTHLCFYIKQCLHRSSSQPQNNLLLFVRVICCLHDYIHPLFVAQTGPTLAPRCTKAAKPPRKWTPAEDTKLNAAVTRHLGRKWKKIADDVGTRDHVQCLQRWKKVRAHSKSLALIVFCSYYDVFRVVLRVAPDPGKKRKNNHSSFVHRVVSTTFITVWLFCRRV